MINRSLKNLLEKRLEVSPAVALLGPRQCGKTTLAKNFGMKYYDLETDVARTRVDVAWSDLMASQEVVIFDEAQTFPAIFPRLRAAIDSDRSRNNRFLLLGSVAPALMMQVSESLAGRLAIVELTPLLLGEVGAGRLDELWLKGGFPGGGILADGLFSHWQSDYLRLMAERDLPSWGLPASPKLTERLLKMTAAVNAQQMNLSQLGQSLGISHPTVRGYLDFLEGAYLLRLLNPYHGNVRKRLVKAPRLYWRDSGLLHALWGVKSFDQLLDHPSVGWSWEGFVLEQIISTIKTSGVNADFYYFRTSDGYEVDLIIDAGGQKWGIEVKLTSSPSPDDLRKLRKSAEMCDCTRHFLLSRTTDPVVASEGGSVNLESMLEVLARDFL